jgi:hypothetical protein
LGGREAKLKKIFVIVSGGVAYPGEQTVPAGYEIEIIDFDDIKEGQDDRSEEAKSYCSLNQIS